jgi:hypothetical protein
MMPAIRENYNFTVTLVLELSHIVEIDMNLLREWPPIEFRNYISLCRFLSCAAIVSSTSVLTGLSEVDTAACRSFERLPAVVAKAFAGRFTCTGPGIGACAQMFESVASRSLPYIESVNGTALAEERHYARGRLQPALRSFVFGRKRLSDYPHRFDPMKRSRPVSGG